MDFHICGADFYLNNHKTKIISGAVHYFRNMPDTWDDIFLKLKAMGCNCVETYCAWNLHEKKPGEYDFSGWLDISAFLERAAAHGLMIIVRPGPYICAEWEFGGLPWWLHTQPDMEIRCCNESYMRCFSRYLKELFNQIRPQLTTNGGNVIMLQVENEYGSYGDDKAYLRELVKIYRENGIDVPLVTSDGEWRAALLDGTVEGCVPTLNFGTRVAERFALHDILFPDAPKMCMEMWNGWFDHWGEDIHHTTSAESYAQVVDDMLHKGSMNMYMFIGGTNFGFMAGANHTDIYRPDVTSYDYDALLTECGDITPKYWKVREVIQKHIGKELPPVPANRPKKGYGKVPAMDSTPLFENIKALSKPIHTVVPKCMEDCGVGYGYVLYETKLGRDYIDEKLSFEQIGDRAQVFINQTHIGTVFTTDEHLELTFSAKAGDTMQILCENLGRVNFGPRIMGKKGIIGRLFFGENIHYGWDAYPLPMDNLDKLTFTGDIQKSAPGFYRFTFEIPEKPVDTFLRTDNFRKGFAVVNGFNLGRFWEIGPQKTLYVPAGLLKQGKNEIILFESDGLKDTPEIEFVDTPDLGPVSKEILEKKCCGV